MILKKTLLFFCLFLVGCGFSPLYKTVQTNEGNVPIFVQPIAQSYGNSMRQRILNRLGTFSESSSKYTLIVDPPTFSSWDQAIDNKNFSSIVGIKAETGYRLVDKTKQKTILSDRTFLSDSHSVVNEPYATVVAEKKVKTELAEQLAEQICQHVLVVLSKEKE